MTNWTDQRVWRAAAAATAVVLFLATEAGAQTVEAHADAPVARATHAEGGVVVDGRLDERDWERAEPITEFTQVDPVEGAPVSQPTEVRVLYGEGELYVGARLRDTAAVSSRLGRRDAYLRDSDWFSITVDSYHDHRTAYRFMVNPAGVRADEVLSGSTRWGDDTWDPVWEVATAVVESGWVAEMRIPFSQLRFSEEREQVWGVQFEREIARRQEEAVFSFTPKNERGGIARFGHLVGLEGLARGEALELLPYVAGQAEYVDVGEAADASFENPYRDGSDYLGRTGVNLKYRVTSNLTLDAAVNPDFGQVEVDPAVVNLSAFETRFDENRPFFVEGANIFRFGDGGGRGTQLLYSRRIGGSPRWDAPDEAVYEEVPDAATILGAAKLTGRTAGGWSIGVLEAVTAEETGRYVDEATAEKEAVAAPLTNYLVGRLERSLRQGRTVVGGLATAVNRRLGDLPIATDLRGSAYTGGVDFRHEWADRAWSVSGHFAASRIVGDPEAIADAQRSSARYFHRPDAGHLRLDSARTTLSGYTADLELSKEAGTHWRGSVGLGATSPGFEVNDLGYQRYADRIMANASLRYVENQPGPVFREWSVNARSFGFWNYGRTFLGSEVSLEASGELLSYWGGEVEYSRSISGLDDRLTRGGPLTRDVTEQSVSARFRSDSRKAWGIGANLERGWDAAGSTSAEAGVRLELRPADAWSISIGPELSREHAVAQYMGSVGDPVAGRTFGRRYLFSDLEQTTLGIDTRLNIAFRPGLTLELYAQPFLASAAFDGLKELEAPRTFSFVRYDEGAGTIEREGEAWRVDPDAAGPADPFTVDDPDFNRRSLRGNAVLRWQWRPGSTLFLVWQQQRTGSASVGDFRFGRDASALFGAAPDNVFMIKMNYWLNP